MARKNFRVSLLQVEYARGDIGNDWVYDLNVDGATKHYPEHTLNPGKTEVLGDVIVTKVVSCPTTQYSFPVVIDVTEVDTFYNDLGSRTVRVNLPCQFTTKFDVTVDVAEKGGSGSASLKFYFEADFR